MIVGNVVQKGDSPAGRTKVSGYRSRIAICTISLGLALPSASATAAPAAPAPEAGQPLKVRTIKEVTVASSRPVATAGGASAVETAVDSLETPVAASVEEVLRELPALHVRTNSRGEAELSARGSESRQVAILLDGIPITLAWDARADVSVIPAAGLQEVTYTRGLSSMLHGPNVLGGVVEASLTERPTRNARRSAQLSIGADDTGAFATEVAAALPAAAGSGRWITRAGLGFRNSPGEPLARTVDEPVETGDGLRLNTDAERVHGFLSLRYEHDSRAWITLTGSSFREARGIAAELNVPDEQARFWRYPHVSRTMAALSAGTGFRPSLLGGHGQLQASLGYDQGQSQIEAYASRDYDEVIAFDDGEDHTLTARLVADHTLGAKGKVSGAFTWTDIRHDESIPAGDFAYQQQLMSIGLEHTWRPLRARGWVRSLNLSWGAAYDRAVTPKTGGRARQGALSELGGRLGVSLVVGESRTILHAGISRRGRFPALRELYSGALDRFLPNPDLEPEKLLTAEAGVTRRFGRGEVQAVLFRNLLEDAVVRTTLDDGTGRLMRVNRDELESQGLELLVNGRLGPVALTAGATAQSVTLTDTEAQASHRPENLPELFGDLTVNFPLPLGLEGRTRLEYTGDQSVIDVGTGNDAKLDGKAILHASLSREWPFGVALAGGMLRRVTARLTAENLGDVALYEAWGLPGPGRRFRLELRMH